MKFFIGVNWRLLLFAGAACYNLSKETQHVSAEQSKRAQVFSTVRSLQIREEWTFIGNEDISLIRYFKSKERYADLINGYVFHGRQVVSGNDVEELDPRKTGRKRIKKNGRIKYRQRYRDFVRRTVFGMNCMIIAIENQNLIHYAMPIRVMDGDAMEYSEQMERICTQNREKKDTANDAEFLGQFRKTDRVPGAISLVLYYGEEPWDGARDIYELLDLSEIPEELRKMVNHYPIHVLEVRRFENTEWFQTDLREVFEILKYADDKQELKNYVESNEERLDNMANDACELIADLTNTPEFAFNSEKYQDKEGKVKMCRGMKEWLDEKFEEGHAEGHEECKIDQICKKLRKQKMIETIADELEENIEVIRDICSVAAEFAPEYELEKVLQAWREKRMRNKE